jgi:hypothetical protein
MGVCVLVASGAEFDVDRFLRDSPFKPHVVYHKGEIPAKDNPGGKPLTDSGFVLLVAQVEYPQLIEQVYRALVSLNKEFQRLKDAGANKILLDFGITDKSLAQRSQFFFPELLSAMSSLGMGLVVSVVHEGGPSPTEP